MKPLVSACRHSFVAVSLVVTWPLAGLADTSPGSSGGGESGSRLSSGEREALHEAMRAVWSDPEVVSAREEAERSMAAYKETLRKSMERADPGVSDLIKRFRPAPDRRPPMRKGGRPSEEGPSEMRSLDQLAVPPGFLEELSQDERERFLAAQATARKSDAVSEVVAELQGVREEDEKLRRRRMAVMWKLRRTIHREMVKSDPSLEEILGRIGRAGPARGKTKGRQDDTRAKGSDAPGKADRENPEEGESTGQSTGDETGSN